MFKDKTYLRTLIKIAIPIIFQQLVMNSLNMVDTVMVGQLGEEAVAAIGLANQIFFILSVILFGIASGAAIFTAQFWGKKDLTGIQNVLWICLILAVSLATVFTLLANKFPETILGIYTKDKLVIEKGSQYLSIVSLSYIATAVTYSFSSIMKSTENVKTPMIISVIAISLNTFLNYILIFGHFGFPQLGIRGAAIATVIIRSLETGVYILISMFGKLPTTPYFRNLFNIKWDFLKKYLTTTLPVLLNEISWSFGMTSYSIVYARISTQSIAAFNISSTVDNVAMVFYFGLANASAIMIGNRIGAGEEEKGRIYGVRLIKLSVLIALVCGAAIFVSKDFVISLYNISDLAASLARNLLIVVSSVVVIKALNISLLLGILRSGGDTRFTLLVEMICIWLVGVPLAVFGAFVLHLPVHFVVLLVTVEEIIKFGFLFRRFRSGKWLNNLVKKPEPETAFSI
ncbi:MAG: MATE family efflux transporter [Anaerolineaceae bacterium]|nr:MATE family efflux transporter [Anaerolineaceae bacterium]